MVVVSHDPSRIPLALLLRSTTTRSRFRTSFATLSELSLTFDGKDGSASHSLLLLCDVEVAQEVDAVASVLVATEEFSDVLVRAVGTSSTSTVEARTGLMLL